VNGIGQGYQPITAQVELFQSTASAETLGHHFQQIVGRRKDLQSTQFANA